MVSFLSVGALLLLTGVYAYWWWGWIGLGGWLILIGLAMLSVSVPGLLGELQTRGRLRPSIKPWLLTIPVLGLSPRDRYHEVAKAVQALGITAPSTDSVEDEFVQEISTAVIGAIAAEGYKVVDDGTTSLKLIPRTSTDQAIVEVSVGGKERDLVGRLIGAAVRVGVDPTECQRWEEALNSGNPFERAIENILFELRRRTYIVDAWGGSIKVSDIGWLENYRRAYPVSIEDRCLMCRGCGYVSPLLPGGHSEPILCRDCRGTGAKAS